ncbi:MAG: FtsK/SpoIIIE domain-containing protein [Actinomycetes bacterium]
MRLMLTVVTDRGNRDVLVEGDETTTVADLAEALAGGSPGSPGPDLSNVVRLRSRAPYGLDRAGGGPSGRGPRDRGRDAAGPRRRLWLDGRPLEPDALVFGLLREGDVVALEPRSAAATVTEEPGGVVEVRVVGGPAAGAVHRLGLGVYTIGSDPAAAVVVDDPAMPPLGAVLRITPHGITVEPPPADAAYAGSGPAGSFEPGPARDQDGTAPGRAGSRRDALASGDASPVLGDDAGRPGGEMPGPGRERAGEVSRRPIRRPIRRPPRARPRARGPHAAGASANGRLDHAGGDAVPPGQGVIWASAEAAPGLGPPRPSAGRGRYGQEVTGPAPGPARDFDWEPGRWPERPAPGHGGYGARLARGPDEWTRASRERGPRRGERGDAVPGRRRPAAEATRRRRRGLWRRAEPAPVEREDPAAPRLDGVPLTEPATWEGGRLLRCGDSLFACGPVEPPDAHLDTLPDGGLAYNRPPRLAPAKRVKRFEVPAEPKRGEGMRLQLLAALLPAVFGLVMAVAFQLWYFLLIALMTPAIMIGQWWSDRRHGRKKHRQALKVYRRRLAEFEEEVERARVLDEAERRAAAPDPAELLLTAKGPRRRLWERRIHDPDVLRLRVGLADLPADLEFVPERGAADVKLPDPPIARNVPVSLAMRRLGVAGITGARSTATAVARWLVGQAATLHSPRDLAIVVLSAKADGAEQWSWVRWLPHCGPRGSDCAALVGADPEAAARRVAELASLVAERLDEDGPYARAFQSAGLDARPGGWDEPQWTGAGRAETGPAFAAYSDRPYDVLLILDGAQVLRALPGMPQVLRQGPRVGVYTIAIDDDRRLLPEECATVVSCGVDGRVRLHGGGLDALGPILADQVSPWWAEQLARSLAPLRDVGRGDPSAALPSSARLLDLLGLSPPTPQAIRAKWTGHTTEALIGVGPEGPFSVDLRRDGPHGLVAGTTGAGKSELLQTLICALAVVNRPDEMTFVLIDYKGGAAFKECVRLPHTVGMVSDLDRHLTQRALESLAAEIRRRERILLAAGAKDIEDYQDLRAKYAGAARRAGTASAPPRYPAGGPPAAGPPPGDRPEHAASVPAQAGAAAGRGMPAGRAAAGSPSAASPSASPLAAGAVSAGAAPVVPAADARARAANGTLGHGAAGLGVTGTVADGPGAAAAAAHVATAAPGGPGLLAGGSGTRPATAEPAAGVGAAALEPLPRLVLIIDEFAALVAELPDFVEGLVDIARRGRSLGIHLILATQRPQGVVTADIQANTSLRIALRVTDTTESSDVIDGPEAAHIPKSLPGRCYVKSGAGAPVAVQAARVGGRAPGRQDRRKARVVDLSWQALGHPVRLGGPVREDVEETDLSLLVDAIREAAREEGIPAQPSPWLPPLPDTVVLGGTPELALHVPGRPDGEVPPLPFGLTDLPWAQSRRPLVLDLVHGGHLLIAGTSRTGRSTALRTIAGSIAANASPADVHLHAIDCGSGALLPLVAMPHCGAVVTRDQIDRVERLLGRLRAEVARRQRVLAEAGYASLAEARAAARASGGAGHGGRPVEHMPWLVLMLDRWEGFVAAFEQYDYGRLIEAIMQLLREGPAVGLRAVMTSDRSGLLGQISTVFDDKLVLRLSDPTDYGLAGLPTKNLPSSIPPGRALAPAEHGVVESQIALLCPDPAGPAQVAELQALARKAAERWGPNPNPPLRVDALPMRITASQVRDLDPEFTPPSPLWALLGAGGDALAPLGIDLLAQGPAAIVAGPPRSGRSSTLVTAARSLLSRDVPVLIVTPRRSPLRDLAGAPGVLAVLDGGGRPLDGSPEEPLSALVADQARYVVLVDDAELVSPDTSAGMALEEILRTGRDEEHGLLIAGTTGDLATAYRGFVAEARKSRTGLLLSVQSPADGDLFSVRLPRGAVGGPTGRGLLIISGTATPIQAAVPD